MAVKKVASKLAPEAQLRTYVDKLDPKTQKLVRSVRTALRKQFPTANELAYDYSNALVIGYAPGEAGIHAIVGLRASDAGVSLYFNQGPKLSDPAGLLKGSGKLTRFIVLESAAQLKQADVAALIDAAVDQAKVPFPTEGKGSLIIKSGSTKKR